MKQSVWLDTVEMPKYAELNQDRSVDVCVVGGGIAGITTAFLLAKQGKSVVLVEAMELGSGQTGRTTAHISYALDDRYFNLERYHGRDGARLAFQSHAAAIREIETIVREENIDCDFMWVDGYLFSGTDSDRVLDKELHAALRAGAPVQMTKTSPLSFFDMGRALRFRNQIQLHPLKYLKGLVQSSEKYGVRFFTQTRVFNVKTIDGDRDIIVECEGANVFCDAVVVATNTPINDVFAIHTKQAPYRSYVLCHLVAKNSVPAGLYWDTLEPYHYVRTQPLDDTHDLLIVGGEDHKTGQEENPERCFERLESWARDRFPMIESTRYRWSGQIMEPVDGLAFLGHNPKDRDGIFVITGDSGQGMTHATIGALLVTDQIFGRTNEWEKLYDPSRVSLKTSSAYIKENVNVVLQYGDWLMFKSKTTLDELEKGEGVVYREGFTPIAAYKNEQGEVQTLSAVCPHLAGIVRWNSVEKSWDCPCHGSRFDCDGRVIEGPAKSGLNQVELETDPKEHVGTGRAKKNGPKRPDVFANT